MWRLLALGQRCCLLYSINCKHYIVFMLSAQEIIARYKLAPLDQEGGYFRQVWRSPVRVENTRLQGNYSEHGDHPIGTLIYFLITAETFSALHRLPTEEHWMYHLGDSCEQLLLNEDGTSECRRIGADLLAGEFVHVTTPKNSWQGTRLIAGGSYGYMFGSCIMVPGFEWADFELGNRVDLEQLYPSRKEEIQMLTRAEPVEGTL